MIKVSSSSNNRTGQIKVSQRRSFAKPPAADCGPGLRRDDEGYEPFTRLVAAVTSTTLSTSARQRMISAARIG